MKGRVISLHGVLRSKRFKWTLAAAAVLLAIGIITGVILWETRGGVTADRPEVTEIFGVPVHTVFIPETLPGRPGIKREVKFIVIHETGNPSEGADAKAHSDYLLNGGEGTTSWHYTVDDHEIYHHIPDSEVSWNAGDRRQEPGGNMNGIGIEMCVNSDGNYEQTLINTEKLCARLLIEYDLNPSKALKKHQDFSGKICPSTLINSGRWDEFCSAVTAKYKELKADEAAKAS